MSEVTSTRSSFFPKNDRASLNRANKLQAKILQRNDKERSSAIKDNTKNDARVKIPDAVKDFARIKKAVDLAPPKDNSAKVAKLKEQIQAGQYKINFDALADRMLETEL